MKQLGTQTCASSSQLWWDTRFLSSRKQVGKERYYKKLVSFKLIRLPGGRVADLSVVSARGVKQEVGRSS